LLDVWFGGEERDVETGRDFEAIERLEWREGDVIGFFGVEDFGERFGCKGSGEEQETRGEPRSQIDSSHGQR
jgi:hypothetical protein